MLETDPTNNAVSLTKPERLAREHPKATDEWPVIPTGFDPVLRISEGASNVLIISFLATIHAVLHSVRRQVLEIQQRLDPSVSREELVERLESEADEAFEEIMAEALAKFGE